MALFLCPDCNQHIRVKTVCPNCHPRTYSSGLPLALLLGIGCHKTEPAKPEVMALYGAPPMEVFEQLEQDTDDKQGDEQGGEQGGEQDDQNAEDVDGNQTDTEDGEQSKPNTDEDSTDGVNNGDEDGSTTDSDKNVEEAEPVKPVVKPLYGLPARPDPTIKRP